MSLAMLWLSLTVSYACLWQFAWLGLPWPSATLFQHRKQQLEVFEQKKIIIIFSIASAQANTVCPLRNLHFILIF